MGGFSSATVQRGTCGKALSRDREGRGILYHVPTSRIQGIHADICSVFTITHLAQGSRDQVDGFRHGDQAEPVSLVIAPTT